MHTHTHTKHYNNKLVSDTSYNISIAQIASIVVFIIFFLFISPPTWTAIPNYHSSSVSKRRRSIDGVLDTDNDVTSFCTSNNTGVLVCMCRIQPYGILVTPFIS